MKGYSYAICICLALLLFSCEKRKTETQASKPALTLEDSIRCIHYKSNRKLSETFPFSEADKIVVHSYEARLYGHITDKLISNGKFTLKDFKETITLDPTQKDSLFALFYDYKTRYDECGAMIVAACYVPRHSIVFYKGKKAIAFLELCLECGHANTNDTNFGDFCYGKMDLFEKYFKSIGIKEGLPNEMLQKLKDEKRIKDSLRSNNITSTKNSSL